MEGSTSRFCHGTGPVTWCPTQYTGGLRMRAWTLGVSVVFHLCVITSVVVAPLFAIGELPEPPRSVPVYRLVTTKPPDPPPLRRPDTAAPQSSSATLLTAQTEILPETPRATEPVAGPADFGVP